VVKTFPLKVSLCKVDINTSIDFTMFTVIDRFENKKTRLDSEGGFLFLMNKKSE